MRWMTVCIAGVLSGCAIVTSHLPVTSWPLEKRAMYYQDPKPFRMAVLSMRDHRPPQERHGQRPGGMFLLLWNKRIGDYYTGDHLFGGHVAQDLSTQAVSFLRSSNVFADVVSVPTPLDIETPLSPARITAIGNEQVVDYVLASELQHFFGSQFQHTSLYVVPLYFISMSGWQDSKTLPWGKTTVSYALYDARTGDMVWRRMFESSHTMPRDKDSMAEAAMESFGMVMGDVVVDLRNLQLPSNPPATDPL